MKEAKVDFIDDGPGKPVGINRFIGRRPIFAFGNSDGDQQMLQWTAAGDGPRFVALVHHTDAEREFAYDRTSHIGKLDKALDEANAKGWIVVDMKNDWATVFAKYRSTVRSSASSFVGEAAQPPRRDRCARGSKARILLMLRSRLLRACYFPASQPGVSVRVYQRALLDAVGGGVAKRSYH